MTPGKVVGPSLMETTRMRSQLVLLLGVTLGIGGLAQAQTATGPSDPESRGYAEFVAHSAFGNAPSQSYGAEFGFRIAKDVQVFAEGGRTSNVAPATFGADAQIIALYLQQTQSAPVSFTAKEPITFGAGGLKYLIPTESKMEPYVLAGFGAARVKRNARFVVGGADMTTSLASLGVVLGTGLSGSSTKPMVTLGGGIAWPLWQAVTIDFQYRFGRIFDADRSITTHLAGAGLGVRF
jgi:opacity protein-like surface antigen